jgi:hypothetical protein
MTRFFKRALIVVAATIGIVFTQVAPASATVQDAATTIDFSTVGQGPFDQSSFKADGIVFTEGTFVCGCQGDDALVGPMTGEVKGGFNSISAQVAPGFQGTAAYTLAAFKHGEQIATRSLTVTQDTGDPTTGPSGYFTIDIGPLPKKADSFSLSNVFVRSSFPDVTQIEFGASSITFSRKA